MRSLVNLFGTAALTVGLGFAATAQASEYVPNRQSDTFRFKNIRFGSETDVSVSQVSSGWKLYNRFLNMPNMWVWTSSTSENVYLWNGSTYELLANFAGQVGSTARITIGCNNGTVRLAEKNISVQTAAGTFNDCIRLEWGGGFCADAGMTMAWFARGVGVVKWEEQNIVGATTTELISGTINGTTYPQAPALTTALQVSAKASDYEAWINLMPSVGGPRPAKKVSAYIDVKNTSGSDMTFNFTSGQSFEIRLVNASGATVSRWSRGRMFTQATRTLTLKDGETWQFGGEVELTTDTAQHAPQGAYTLVIELKSNPKFSAVLPLTIGHAY